MKPLNAVKTFWNHHWTHPSGRKSSTGMAISILRQLGELLHKAVDIVPGKYGWEDQGNLDFYIPLDNFNSIVEVFIINIIINIKFLKTDKEKDIFLKDFQNACDVMMENPACDTDDDYKATAEQVKMFR